MNVGTAIIGRFKYRKARLRRTVGDLQAARGVGSPERESSKGVGIHYPGFGMMFLIWAGVGALSSMRDYVLFPSRPEMRQLSTLLACAVWYFPWIAFTPVVFRLENRFALAPGRWARNLALLALTGVPVCLLASLSMRGFFVAALFALRAPLPRTLRGILFHEFPSAEIIFWCSVAVGYSIRTFSHLRQQERLIDRLALEKARLEAGLNQVQLEVLRARLNPHFLFNSLQNISVLTRQDPQTASRMLTRLGDLLRTVLRQDSQPSPDVLFAARAMPFAKNLLLRPDNRGIMVCNQRSPGAGGREANLCASKAVS